MTKHLWVGDTHFPFADKRVISKILEYVAYFKPDIVGQIGDLYDQYSFSNYSRLVNKFTAEQEMNKGREMAEDFWKKIRSIVPKARCIQKSGNHDARIVKRVQEVLPQLLMNVKIKGKLEHLVNVPKLFKFDGVESDLDYTNETRVDNYIVCHGFRNKGEHVKYYGQNVIVGHSHLGGVDMLRHNNKSVWELNCGFVGDIKSLVFRYGDYRTKNWTPGFGTVDNHGPRFVAL